MSEKREPKEPVVNIIQTYDQMLEWCEEQNARAMFREMERWYYVNHTKLPSGDTIEIKKIDGCDAANIRRVMRDDMPDLGCFTEVENRNYRSMLRNYARRGMTNARYSSIAQGGML